MAKRITNGIAVDKLDQLILDLGVRVRLYHSTVCPNVKSLETLDHNLNCPICNNNMLDFDPIETIAMFQQQDFHEMFRVQGTFDIDEVLVSFLSGQTLQTFTKLELLDFKEDFFELIQRQIFADSDTDLLKYKACEVLGVFIVRNNVKIEFHYGADFLIDVNGSIKWLSTNKPLDKEVYSIYYRYHPVYRAIKAVHRDRFSQYNLRPGDINAPKKRVGENTYVKLPETWILKKDYLLERRDRNGNLIPINTLYDPNSA